MLFPELDAERDLADHVKRDKPILVIIGNPPYNGYAGLAVDEERDLSNAYRTTLKAAKPQGQGLNDLYVRFFRMAERRIVEQSGQGVVCYISNYSWLDGLSFTGMREKFLSAFDSIWIDSLNGDAFRTGKLTPEGESDPSVFSTAQNREGIRVGTSVALMVKQKNSKSKQAALHWREWWGKSKLQDLLVEADLPKQNFQLLKTDLAIGLPFSPVKVGAGYLDWPQLPGLFPVSFPGVKTSRDDVLVDIDRDSLVIRMRRYFDPNASNVEVSVLAPALMHDTARFEANKARSALLKRGMLEQNIVRYSYRPFDTRWLYWEPETKLLDEKRAEYFEQIDSENLWLFTTGKTRQDQIEPAFITSKLVDLNMQDSGARGIPLKLKDAGALFGDSLVVAWHSNISSEATKYLDLKVAAPEALMHHALAVTNAVQYRADNFSGLKQDWPRIPLPATRELLEASAALGNQLAALMDVDTPVAGVTSGAVRAELKGIAVISRVGGGSLNPDKGELALTAGWGHGGKGGVTMPGKGRVEVRFVGGDSSVAPSLAGRAFRSSGTPFAERGARSSKPSAHPQPSPSGGEGASQLGIWTEGGGRLSQWGGVLEEHSGAGLGIYAGWVSGDEEVALVSGARLAWARPHD